MDEVHHALGRAGDHAFGLFDFGSTPVETADWSLDLVVPMSAGAFIATGVHTGPVRITVHLRDHAPETLDDGPWEDVVEATVHAPEGRLRVDNFHHGPPEGLPVLSFAGPGSYRLRAHARGRTINADGAVEEPCEDYLLVIWPAPPAPPAVLKAHRA